MATDSLFIISEGGPDIPPDVYTVVCTKIEGPRTITPQRGPNAGEKVDIFDWEFTILDGDFADSTIQGTTSTSTGPRSKLYGWLTALLGGTPPEPKAGFAAADIVGRMALANVVRNEEGWPKISALTPLPRSMRAAAQAGAMGLPPSTQPAARQAPQPAPRAAGRPAMPARAAAATQPTELDDLPF